LEWGQFSVGRLVSLIRFFFSWFSNCWWVVVIVDSNWFRKSVVGEKWLKTQQTLQVDPLISWKCASAFKIMFSAKCKIFCNTKLSSWVSL